MKQYPHCYRKKRRSTDACMTIKLFLRAEADFAKIINSAEGLKTQLLED